MFINPDGCHRVYLSLGSNMGSRLEYLYQGIEDLRALAIGPLHCSAVYETTPVGWLDQADFLNMVVGLDVHDGPLELLGRLETMERRSGRERTIRFGPRTLDVDILLYDNEYVCYNQLQIPHPRMWERAFVLVPLAELVPQRKALGGRSIAELAKTLSRGGNVRYVGRFW
ncbi:MAG: 2-amino-4-hydroxy-6-hydroxymethyldihydropteridine diphosphokinase [Alicyclobacillus sp. RIFOXYA1_FULL_53_8]|nr:MAG: 2-amino-4-hydroxy-6-hydroxymethyldihydropteridine diphosphokinase [Alicyclobacillus sp. RIFOXYA1_FULL_53_8]